MVINYLCPLEAAIVAVTLGLFASHAAAQTVGRYPRAVVQYGQDLTLDVSAEVREVIVVSGSLRLEGRVTRDVYVWLGDVVLAPTAVIDGSLIVVAGNLTVYGGAVVGRDLAVIGGTLDAPADFTAGGEVAMVGAPAMGRSVRGLVPWVTRGLIWGRPIVPDLAWVWTVVGVLFVLSIALTLIFGQTVRASADVLVARPLRTFLTGVLVLILTLPLLTILAATIVGLVVVPVVLFALLIVWTIGKVGVARGIGQRVVHESDGDSRLQAIRSLAIGSAAIVLAYMVPVLGLVTWSLVSVFGLGAATIAVLGSLRREYPARKKPPTPPAASDPQDLAADAPLASAPAGSTPLESAPFVEPTSEPPSETFSASPVDSPPPGRLLPLPRAEFLDRAAAFGLDCVLVGIVALFLDSRQEGMYLFLLLAYFIGFWTYQGTTLGGIIVGLRVVRTDGQPLRFVDALVRGLSSLFSFAVLCIGVLWMIQDAERQTWHDKIAGTYVVKVPREWALT